MKYPILNLVMIAFLFFSFGCEKEDEVTCKNDCLDSYLKENGMVSYKGEELGCKNFLSLYEYQGRQYYVLENHCADVAVAPTDCEGRPLCGSGDEESCSEFYQNAKYIGVVGIEA
ncbi:hypothetical protein POKO110462_02405 [Pontibacter korlensis]|uniref:Lipoprotein n=1 Tax=Pontibacter korlensis TaxID=400092 RepID=A0A0E3ZGV1_9BACT|nr:hypothetical protein [Pontibacter korlensis]AKD03680.1 hypothetical protein PKOR_11760 [Pontibacter korlensis]